MLGLKLSKPGAFGTEISEAQPWKCGARHQKCGARAQKRGAQSTSRTGPCKGSTKTTDPDLAIGLGFAALGENCAARSHTGTQKALVGYPTRWLEKMSENNVLEHSGMRIMTARFLKKFSIFRSTV